MKININAFGSHPDSEENRGCIKDIDFLGQIDTLLGGNPTDEQLEEVRKTLFGTNKAWVPRWLFDDLVNVPVEPEPEPEPVPESDHYILTYDLPEDMDIMIIPNTDVSGNLVYDWEPVRLIIDGVEQTELQTNYHLSAGVHVIEAYDNMDDINHETSRGFGSHQYIISFIIPNYIHSIGNDAFGGCTGLTSITIPNRVTYINDGAFGGCTGLTSITIPNDVATIGAGTFYGCTGLTSINIPNSVARIDNSAFSGCTGLTSINIPSLVTSINKYVFENCSGLTSVTIPNSVQYIRQCAFYRCTGLTNVIIGEGIDDISSAAFEGCINLNSITIYAVNPPYIDQTAFNNCPNIPNIYVPSDSVDIYKRNPGWFSQHAGYIQAIPAE